jgi:hypothetical protein
MSGRVPPRPAKPAKIKVRAYERERRDEPRQQQRPRRLSFAELFQRKRGGRAT